MEQRRLEETDERQWKPLKRGWVLGSEQFRAKLLERMGRKLGKHRSGRLRHESAQAKGERIIAQELKRLKWKEPDLDEFRKTHPEKLALAGQLRRETTLTIREIAQRLHMGSWKSLNNSLYLAGKRNAKKSRSTRTKKAKK
jgi:hypothetical protein